MYASSPVAQTIQGRTPNLSSRKNFVLTCCNACDAIIFHRVVPMPIPRR